MNTLIKTFLFAAIAISTSKLHATEKLSDILDKNEFSGIVGTWFDKETLGKQIQMSFNWKLQDRVMEFTSIEGSKTTTGLICVSPADGNIFQIMSDSLGNTSMVQWRFKEKGVGVMNIKLIKSATKAESMKLAFKLTGQNTMTVKLEMKNIEPLEVEMVRMK